MAEMYTHIGHVYGITRPLANAGGPVKTIQDTLAMAEIDIGWIEAGSYTPEPRPDLRMQGQNVYFFNKKTGELFNKFEMPNQGYDQLCQDIPEMLHIAHEHKKPLVVNLAPSASRSAIELGSLANYLYEKGVDAVLVNPDCPSLFDEDGNRMSRISKDADELKNFLAGLKENMRSFRPVYMRLAPPETRAHFLRTLNVVRESGIISAVFVSNTWEINDADRKLLPALNEWKGAGGKSGPAFAHRSARLTEWAIEALQGSNIDVVRSGGIWNANDVTRSDLLGAVGSAASALFFESEKNVGWKEAIDKINFELKESSGNL